MIPKLSKVTIYVEDQQQAKHFWYGPSSFLWRPRWIILPLFNYF